MVRAVGKMASGFLVTKRVAQLNGKKGWWFLVKALERCLVQHWQWQKVHGVSSDFSWRHLCQSDAVDKCGF